MDVAENTRRTKKRSVQEAIVAALVVFSVFVTNILVFGFIAVLPIYLVEFKKVFPDLHNLVLLIVFLPPSVFGLVRSGSSFLSLSANAGLAAYFGEDSRKLIAFAAVGKALGYIIFPILTNYFIELMFWRGSLLLLAATFIQTLPCALMYSTDMYKNTRRETLAVSESNAPNDLYKSDSNVSVEQFQNVGDVQDETISNKLEISEVNNTALNHNEDINTHEKYIREAVIKTLKYDNEPFVINNTQPDKEDSLGIEETAINSIKSEDKETDVRSDKVQTEGKSDSKFSAKIVTVLTNFNFLLFLFAIFITYSSVITTIAILPDYCVQQGLSQAESARIFSVGSFGYVLACFFSIWLIHKNIVPSRIIFSTAATMSGLLICVYPSLSTSTYLTLLTFAVMFTNGLIFSTYLVTIMDYFEIGYFSISMGFGETVIGIGILTFGYLIVHTSTKHQTTRITFVRLLVDGLPGIFQLGSITVFQVS
ncbi:monocarboxylate transporter 5-like [Octopus vulgaris]|uniref:Monocarboxylate transporter 5-like n=1 Tax=Octopus vulgaris TaxID=6645 RepID=A0AA36F6D8_OCTVU|nr:monocarboxylate transporter 5-like [Octopus vulgaris]